MITLIGDIAFNGNISENPSENNTRFSEVIPVLSQSDLVFANLEVPIKLDESKNEFKNQNHFSLIKPTRELLQLLNIGCVSLANNHIYDYKMSGLKRTIQTLDNLNIYHTGAGWKKEHCDPIIIYKNDIKIAFLSYVDKSTNPKTESFPELYINYFEPKKVKRDIYKIKNTVDKVICSVHWGNDYSFYPTKNQITIAHEIVDAGADIIMGHHPHTLQPYEEYNSGTIFYSLGGLSFGDFVRNNKMIALYRKTKKGVIANCNLSDMSFNFKTTKEKQGNYIKLTNRSYKSWSKKYWRLYKIKNSSILTKNIFNFYESVIYRIYEYFFGYYQNPIKRLFQLSNFRKFKKLF